ncbi:MAG: lactate utilization protein [Halobacteriales archaeon]|nr:lactate utilization protein [Halobacteriales archaeon]
MRTGSTRDGRARASWQLLLGPGAAPSSRPPRSLPPACSPPATCSSRTSCSARRTGPGAPGCGRQATLADSFLGSVNALTEDGSLVAADGSGSRIGGYAFGAEHVVLVGEPLGF